MSEKSPTNAFMFQKQTRNFEVKFNKTVVSVILNLLHSLICFDNYYKPYINNIPIIIVNSITAT